MTVTCVHVPFFVAVPFCYTLCLYGSCYAEVEVAKSHDNTVRGIVQKGTLRTRTFGASNLSLSSSMRQLSYPA